MTTVQVPFEVHPLEPHRTRAGHPLLPCMSWTHDAGAPSRWRLSNAALGGRPIILCTDCYSALWPKGAHQ